MFDMDNFTLKVYNLEKRIKFSANVSEKSHIKWNILAASGT